MKQSLLDSLTRAVAAPTPAHAVWRVVSHATAASLMTLIGRTLVDPQSAKAAIGETCTAVAEDGSCPPEQQKKTKSGNQPTANGCGPEGGSIKLPQGYGNADYTSSCNGHDFCYEECATSKDQCDEDFEQDMYDSCAAAYPGVLNSLFRFGCYERAYAYYQAVSIFGGSAWSAAQQKACECCDQPTTVYCHCNTTCYEDVMQCLDECEVSLGCFGGICGPATEEQCSS
jgi:hypothetical protein